MFLQSFKLILIDLSNIEPQKYELCNIALLKLTTYSLKYLHMPTKCHKLYRQTHS